MFPQYKYFWNISYSYTAFIYLLHAINTIKRFLIQAHFPFDWGCLFFSQSRTVSDGNEQSQNLLQIYKHASLCKRWSRPAVLKVCFLNRSIITTWELVRNTNSGACSTAAKSETLGVGPSDLCFNRPHSRFWGMPLSTTEIYTLSI